MKSLFIIVLSIIPIFSFANSDLLTCEIPHSANTSLSIQVTNDTTMDFLQLILSDNGEERISFAQFRKGEIEYSLQQGFLNAFLVNDQTKVEDSVYRNVGFLGLSATGQGRFEGFLSAYGNIYPMNCLR